MLHPLTEADYKQLWYENYPFINKKPKKRVTKCGSKTEKMSRCLGSSKKDYEAQVPHNSFWRNRLVQSNSNLYRHY